jgi:hypothetical protein
MSPTGLTRAFLGAIFGLISGLTVVSAQDNPMVAEEAPPKVVWERIEDSPLKPLSEIRFELLDRGAAKNRAPEPNSLPATTPAPSALAPRDVHWCATNLRYNRPYFEELLLERHGLSHRPFWQPAISAARFYTTAALLPVLKWRKPHCDMYDHRAFGNPGSPLCRQ